MTAAIALALGRVSAAEDASEHDPDPVDRFFSGCPDRPRLTIHRDAKALDLHTVAYTTANILELEVVRLADWLIDLPVPGVEIRLIERTLNGIRVGYARIGRNRPMRRLAEFVDALQLRELSLGDVTTAQNVASGGTVAPGSGTVVRINRLIDWTQHVTGDVNQLLGWPLRRHEGVVRWSGPGRAVDLGQKGLLRVFHTVSISIAKLVDGSVNASERGIERLINVPRPVPHRQTTVFARLSAPAYRAHELWILEHRARLFIGTPEQLSQLDHAQLFHRRRGVRAAFSRHARRGGTWEPERMKEEPDAMILVTDRRTFATAPQSLQAYAVPAEWALGGMPEPAPDQRASPVEDSGS